MDKKTVKQLNQINKDFYLKTQVYFNRTRQFYWQGWEKIVPHLQRLSLKTNLKVLDVGCGNGRFGQFLLENNFEIDYTGLDSNQYLLNRADENIKSARLVKTDILKKWPVDKKFDLIVIFGVIHHIPGFKNRLKIFSQAKKLLNNDGLIVVSSWQFKKLTRMNRKIVTNHNIKGLENNDYILDWKKGVTAKRYCHFVDNKEFDKLISQTGLKLIDSYFADAKEGKGNQYLILQDILRGRTL